MFAIRFSHILIFIFLFLTFSVGIVFSIFNNQLIDFSVLEYNPGRPSILLDDQGNEWARFELDKRSYTKFEKFPKHLIQAFLAAEDRNFFQHSGISWKGIIRSVLINIRHGRIIQGASTISQQLVKLLFFDSKKTFKRKVKEQFFALIVETQFSKQQILEMYLNHIYFGCGIYGVEAAAQRFFGKSVQEISVSQAAMLAAIVKSPITYCPLLEPISAQKRRDLILSLMRELNFINEEEFKKEKGEQLKIESNIDQNIAPHLKETLRIVLEDKIGKQNLYCGGYKIQTTLNINLQKNAQQEFKKQFINLRKELAKDIDGGFICMDVKNGEIKAMVGGFDFVSSKWNRALQAKRQMGSIFKPIVYAAALEAGMNFADTEIDEPIEIEFGNTKWSPNNNTRRFEGKMTLARALSFSNNTIVVKILLKVGCTNVMHLAKKFKFSSQINPYPSLALGCVDATLKEAIGAFNVFANNGEFVEPHFIKWIKDEWGAKIWKNSILKEQVLNPFISDQVAKVLSIGMKRYMDRLNNKPLSCEIIGKTGTTNKSRTCWFCGATPNLITAIYVGCDDGRSVGENIYAARTAFPIWLGFNQKINPTKNNFSYDPSLKEFTIDWVTGKPCNEADNPNMVKIFI